MPHSKFRERPVFDNNKGSLTLFKPGFFWLSMTRGVDSTPLQKIMLQLSQDNKTWHTCLPAKKLPPCQIWLL